MAVRIMNKTIEPPTAPSGRCREKRIDRCTHRTKAVGGAGKSSAEPNAWRFSSITFLPYLKRTRGSSQANRISRTKFIAMKKNATRRTRLCVIM